MKQLQFLSLVIAAAVMVVCLGSLRLIEAKITQEVSVGSLSTDPEGGEFPGVEPPSSETDAQGTDQLDLSPVQQRLSVGEKILIEAEEIKEPNPIFRDAKSRGVAAMAREDYSAAAQAFQEALQVYPNAPETLIYLNNAEIGEKEFYMVAIAVPIEDEKVDGTNVAKEMLRGIAQAQKEVNEGGGINGVPLRVLIADDDSDEAMGKQIATALVENHDILAVIGHFTSDVSLAASEIYQEKGLVMISPTSTSVALSTQGNYIFRSLTSDSFNATALVRYLRQGLALKQAAIFYNSESAYSTKLREVFKERLFVEDGKVVTEFDLIDTNFDATTAVKEATDKGAEALILFHNSGILDMVLEVIKANTARLPILSGDSGYKPEMLELSEYTENLLVATVPWNLIGNENSPFAISARNLWTADVSWRTAMTYDAAQALITALVQADEDDRAGIQAALAAPDFMAEGVADTIQFQQNTGDRDGSPQLVTVGRSGNTASGYSFVLIQD